MPSNRKYAGPHDVAELMVDDGVYVAVVRDDLDDDTVLALGYVFDDDDAVRLGRPKVVRTITVSDELGAKLDRSFFDVLGDDGRATGETTPQWPSTGGRAGDPVDTPHTNPATMPVVIDDGTPDGITLTAAEADDRAYDAQAALEAQERVAAEVPADTAAADAERAQRDRIAAIEARVIELNASHAAAVEADDEAAVEAIEAESENLIAEKANIEKALAAGKGN